jgi:thiamine biosynthesis lipoprotein ApbE
MKNNRAFPVTLIKESNSRAAHFLFILLYLLSVLILSGCAKKEKTYKESRTAMYTTCTITVLSRSPVKAKEAIDAGFAEIKRLEAFMGSKAGSMGCAGSSEVSSTSARHSRSNQPSSGR